MEILAASNSTDRGLRALVDLAAAADPDTVNTRRPLSRNDVNATSVIPGRNRPGDSENVSFGEFLEAGQRRGELEESSEVLAVTLAADGQSAVAGGPGQGAFDLPPVPAEALAAADAATGDPQNNAPCPQPPAVYGIVVTLVRPQPAGPATTRTTTRTHRRNRSDHRLQHDTVVGVHRGHRRDEGNALGVGQDVDLRAVLTSIDRAGTG